MNHDADGFEDAPNMVPGEVEAAKPFDANGNGLPRKAGKVLPLFVLTGLLLAGGWAFANQEQYKTLLGLESESQCNKQFEGADSQTCNAELMALQEGGCEGTCPLAATEKLAAGEGTCCDKGRKNAMVAALLAGVEEKPEGTDDTAKVEADGKTEEIAQPEKEPQEKVSPTE